MVLCTIVLHRVCNASPHTHLRYAPSRSVHLPWPRWQQQYATSPPQPSAKLARDLGTTHTELRRRIPRRCVFFTAPHGKRRPP